MLLPFQTKKKKKDPPEQKQKRKEQQRNEGPITYTSVSYWRRKPLLLICGSGLASCCLPIPPTHEPAWLFMARLEER